jgi:hypothetical protein
VCNYRIYNFVCIYHIPIFELGRPHLSYWYRRYQYETNRHTPNNQVDHIWFNIRYQRYQYDQIDTHSINRVDHICPLYISKYIQWTYRHTLDQNFGIWIESVNTNQSNIHIFSIVDGPSSILLAGSGWGIQGFMYSFMYIGNRAIYEIHNYTDTNIDIVEDNLRERSIQWAEYSQYESMILTPKYKTVITLFFWILVSK